MFKPSSEKLHERQLRALRDLEIRQVSVPIPPSAYIEIAKDARSLMLDTAPRYKKKADDDYEANPRYSYTDTASFSQASLRVNRKSRFQRFLQLIESAWFLLILRFSIFIITAIALHHDHNLHKSNKDTAMIYIIVWSSVTLAYSISYVPLLYFRPGINPFSYRPMRLRATVVCLDGFFLAFETVATGLSWEMYFISTTSTSTENTIEDVIEDMMRLSPKAYHTLAALQTSASALWALAFIITVMLAMKEQLRSR